MDNGGIGIPGSYPRVRRTRPFFRRQQQQRRRRRNLIRKIISRFPPTAGVPPFHEPCKFVKMPKKSTSRLHRLPPSDCKERPYTQFPGVVVRVTLFYSCPKPVLPCPTKNISFVPSQVRHGTREKTLLFLSGVGHGTAVM